MREFTLFCSTHIGNAYNTSYPHVRNIRSVSDFRHAVLCDHVAAEYRTGKDKHGNDVPYHRSTAGFVKSNCLMMDVDNTHTDNEKDWVTADSVKRAFPG